VIQTIKMNLDDKERLIAIAKALSVETRIEILRKLRSQDFNINELAEALNIPASSAAAHIKVLEEAGLIKTTLKSGVRGSMKVCHIVLDHIDVEVNTTMAVDEQVEVISMPIGSYVDYKVEPTCGLVGAKGAIGEEDEPRSFYNPERFDAKLLWLGNGYVEYRFPNNHLKDKKEQRLELSVELCSEDHEYNLEFPSDITLWINGIEAGTWTCPSDFGGRRGKLNPDWWPDKNTQYGILKTWAMDQKGTYIDGQRVSEHTIQQYHLYKKEYISVKIGIKEQAKNIGGINIFGDCFGDYNQNIVMKIYFENE
jgi:predicted transcriptional regulator